MRKRERGSAYIFVLLMIVSITVVVLSTAETSMSYVFTQRRLEDSVRAEYALKGAIQHMDAERSVRKLPNPYTNTITIGSIPVTVNVGSVSRFSGSQQIIATCQLGGRTYKRTAYMGTNRPNLFYYALGLKGNNAPGSSLTVGSPSEPGHVFAGGDFAVGSGSAIYGDVDARGVVTPSGGLLGAVVSNLTDDLLGSFSFLDYLLQANSTHLLAANFDNYTFPNVSASSPYHLTYVGGKLRLKGTINGKGTIYVGGDFETNGRITAAPGSRLVIIVNGNADIRDDIDAFLFVKGNVIGSNKVLTGGLYTNGNLNANGLQIKFDPYFARFPDEAVRHRPPQVAGF